MNVMMKSARITIGAVAIIFPVFVSNAVARVDYTIQLNQNGDTIVLSAKQVREGKRLFNSLCSECHVGGVTKGNPGVDLTPGALAGR